MSEPILIGIDVGGTFTDFVVWRAGQLQIHKVPTTPQDQSVAIVQGLRELGLLPPGSAGGTPALPGRIHIAHGMTVATNALLERRGARTALLTTAGFADVLVIGRQNRPFLYRLSQQRPPPLVPDELRLEVDERLDAAGAELRPLDVEGCAALANRLGDAGVASLAIVFLFSFRDPAHERRAAEIVRGVLPDLPISLSSEILPEYREFERTATTVINAYVQPLVARYLGRLERALGQEGDAGSAHIRIMQSNGGVISLRQAAEQAARVVLSGPAGGAVGAFAVARQASGVEMRPPAETQRRRGERAGSAARLLQGAPGSSAGAAPVNVIAFDMGGTSTDVTLCPGTLLTTAESQITDLPLRLPVIDIHTVGAGGGSVAFVDAGGALQVGPRSAGAMPGPACYGRGGAEPTVTDANLVLGRLDPAGFLGGGSELRLDEAAARRVLAGLGAALGLMPEAAALGVARVANATMERALRTVSVERGHDPREFILLPFGGAGPLHACDLAAALYIRRILCPPIPGVLSAYGMLLADVVREASQAILRQAEELLAELAPLHAAFQEQQARVLAAMAAERVAGVTVTAGLDMRYRGQSYELTVSLPLPVGPEAVAEAVAAFHALHEQRYGYAMPGEQVEIVTLRVKAAAPGPAVELPRRPLGGSSAAPAWLRRKPVWFAPDGPVEADVYDRARLEPGNRFAGPAVVLQYDATVVVAPGWQARVDEWANLWLEQ